MRLQAESEAGYSGILLRRSHQRAGRMTLEQAANRQIKAKNVTLTSRKNPPLRSWSDVPIMTPTSSR